MRIVLVHEHYDADHLASVAREMETLGAPTVKAIWVEAYDAWVALEGCHRLRAAHAVGVTPEIEPVEYDETVLASDLGLDWEDDEPVTAAVDRAPRNPTLSWEV